MGKNSIPLRIGRKKPKREMNPVEQWRYKIKQKKNLQSFLKKMKQRENGEIPEKKKKVIRRSPSPESNDPMCGELMTTSSLRNVEEMQKEIRNVMNEEKSEEEREEKVILVKEKPEPKMFIPVSIRTKKTTEKCEEESSGSESESLSDSPVHSFYTSVPKPISMVSQPPKPAVSLSKPPQNSSASTNQNLFKSLLNEDPKLSEFFNSINDLI
ncbi:unnamed protein product [Blepharisma stoltei]|uniref:Uncharacterized protein n=1 Tax=Blepharisma stoltei TaxID=1481888 RepID=A0AAU9IL81_9CILI|nr:unnamed protein product [Blepharisma stoltei]